MKCLNCFIFLIFLSSIGGCSSAGPFITNISSDGRGNLIVEKTTVEHNGFTGTISNKNTTTSTIFLGDKH